MKIKIILFLVLIGIVTSIYAVAPKRYTYPDPPINNGKEVVVAFGSVNANHSEAIDLTASVLYNTLAIDSTLDEDVILRVGTTGGLELVVKSQTIYVRSEFDMPEKLYLKYRSGAPTSGELVISAY